jgi:hypothetical protein
MIAGDENYAPEEMDKRNVVGSPTYGLPWVPLSRASDLVFLEWQQQCQNTGASVGSLKSYFRINISGPNSINIMQQVLSRKGATEGDFAHRTTVVFGEPEYYALIGTDNVSGVAIMLREYFLV